ncbi:MAG TPA: hypothetical protein VI455_02415 [Terriglobia bacterium]
MKIDRPGAAIIGGVLMFAMGAVRANDEDHQGGRALASQSTLLGAAGEHHVMTGLLRRGYSAALAPQGVPNADIVVTDIDGTRLCTIQVKTRRDIEFSSQTPPSTGRFRTRMRLRPSRTLLVEGWDTAA